MGFDEAALGRVLAGLPRPSAWVLAFSGGLDSSVLLHLLARQRQALHTPLRAVHIHHGLLPDAEQWSRHCEQVCRDLQVPLALVRLNLQLPPGESVEACARDARYAALAESLQPREMLLTAQHQDDQAETLLLQLLRGAGIEGLAGMPRCRDWHAGWHARPLLDFPRAQLLDWARAERIGWVEDASNRDTRFDRNYLRHEVMPALRRRWPAAATTIARSADHLASSLSVLQEEAQEDLQRCRQGELLQQDLLFALSPPRRAMVLRAWCARLGYPPPDQRRMRTIESQLASSSVNASPRIDWGPVSLRRYRDRLYLTPNPLPPIPRGPLVWSGNSPLVLPPDCGELYLQACQRGLPEQLWREGRVSVRWPVEGMRCRLPGRAGSRSFKKLCQAWGIPPWVRPYLPLLFVDERLVAIVGFTLDAGFPDTQSPGLCPVWRGFTPFTPEVAGGSLVRPDSARQTTTGVGGGS